MMIHASNMIKYMPVDRNTSNMLAPILDFTNGKFNFSGGGGRKHGRYAST